MRLVTVVGTRPELIRLSRVIPALDDRFDQTLVHTGQNAQATLKDVFFRDLALRPPDIDLGKGNPPEAGLSLGRMLDAVDDIIQERQPHAFLVLGDTNSALSLIAARKRGVTTFHMEAGNRCFDDRVPEELNRRLVDHASSFNLVYTEHARRNLLAEGIHPETICLTGSPMNEVLQFNAAKIDNANVLQRLDVDSGGYLLVSVHRAESVDSFEILQTLLERLGWLHQEFKVPILFSLHPRTRDRIARGGLEVKALGIRFMEPLGFHDYLALQKSAMCSLSDSGTISEESALLGFPAVTLRSRIERPEALEVGSISLLRIQAEPSMWREAIQYARGSYTCSSVPSDYAIENTSVRVTNFIGSMLQADRC